MQAQKTYIRFVQNRIIFRTTYRLYVFCRFSLHANKLHIIYLNCKIGTNNVLTNQKAILALITKFARIDVTVELWTRSEGDRERGAPGYVPGELFCVGLYGWLELRNTVYTLSTLLNFSKNGIKSNSSESVISSNHDATGTCNYF